MEKTEPGGGTDLEYKVKKKEVRRLLKRYWETLGSGRQKKFHTRKEQLDKSYLNQKERTGRKGSGKD